MVEVTVTDNGPGIDADMADKIFDQFQTSKKKVWELGYPSAARLSKPMTVNYGLIKIIGMALYSASNFLLASEYLDRKKVTLLVMVTP